MNRIELENKLINQIHHLPMNFLQQFDEMIELMKKNKIENKPQSLKIFFNQFNADLSEYKFNRDEANER